jgi:diaminopimelate epimerase
MTESISLAKTHATGNDFLVRLALGGEELLDAHAVASLCDRHRGVGADGLITVAPPVTAGADCTFVLQNADGGSAEMSGNGMRALALVAARAGLGTADSLTVDAAGSPRVIRLERDSSGLVVAAHVEMGAATFDPSEIPLACDSAFDLRATVHGTEYVGDAAGMGNPHWVLFVDDVEIARVQQHGPRLERDDRFPNRTNVEFVRVGHRDALTMRVWERGVGETLSCGTGACAAAAVARRRGLIDETVTVRVLGGELRVGFGDTMTLGGPVVHVFDVELQVEAPARR